MAAIDVGSAAIDRAFASGLYTLVDRTNPANASGTITSFEIWPETNLADTKVGTFSGSGVEWDDRDYETIGSVTSGSKQTFSGLNIDVETDDIAGMYFTSGDMEFDLSGGGGVPYKAGDQFGSGVQTYTITWPPSQISLYGIGVTSWTNIAKTNTVTSVNMGKINSATVASVGKFNGTTV